MKHVEIQRHEQAEIEKRKKSVLRDCNEDFHFAGFELKEIFLRRPILNPQLGNYVKKITSLVQTVCRMCAAWVIICTAIK